MKKLNSIHVYIIKTLLNNTSSKNASGGFQSAQVIWHHTTRINCAESPEGENCCDKSY